MIDANEALRALDNALDLASQVDGWASPLEKALAAMDSVLAEKEFSQHTQQVIARLRAELEAVQVDAERYRFIKQNVRKRYGVWWINRISAVTGPTDFEVVVDSARGGK